MDYVFGQCQFVRLEKYCEYYQGKYYLSDVEMDVFIVEQVVNFECYSDVVCVVIVDVCQGCGLLVVSYDDVIFVYVCELVGYGMVIVEFLIIVEVVRVSYEYGLQVLMGVFNVVCGGFYLGNVVVV